MRIEDLQVCIYVCVCECVRAGTHPIYYFIMQGDALLGDAFVQTSNDESGVTVRGVSD